MTARAGDTHYATDYNSIEQSLRRNPGHYTALGDATVTRTFKNQGWYVAGSVYEVWVTPTAPDTLSPTGHTLTQYSYVELQ